MNMLPVEILTDSIGFFLESVEFHIIILDKKILHLSSVLIYQVFYRE